jgi:hypothetical protein
MDQVIDERLAMERRSQGPPGRPPGRQEDGRSRMQAPTKEEAVRRMRNQLQSGEPEDRARQVEFMKAQRERMEERGIRMPSHGPLPH